MKYIEKPDAYGLTLLNPKRQAHGPQHHKIVQREASAKSTPKHAQGVRVKLANLDCGQGQLALASKKTQRCSAHALQVGSYPGLQLPSTENPADRGELMLAQTQAGNDGTNHMFLSLYRVRAQGEPPEPTKYRIPHIGRRRSETDHGIPMPASQTSRQKREP